MMAFLIILLAAAGIAGICRLPGEWIERFGNGLLLAMGFVAGLYLVASQFVPEAVVRYTILVLAGLLAFAGLPSLRRDFSMPASIVAIVAIVAIVVLVIGVVCVGWLSARQPLGSDGLFNFELKARLLFAAQGKLDPAYFQDASLAWTHPRYPPALPALQAWTYAWVGAPDQAALKPLTVLIWLGLAASLCGAFAKPAWIGGILAALTLLIPGLGTLPGGATWLWGDFLLAAFYTAALLHLVKLEEEPRRWLPFALFVALLPFTKREGNLLGLTLLLLALPSALRLPNQRKGRVVWVATAVLFVAVVGAWQWFLAAAHSVADVDFMPINSETFLQYCDRIPTLLQLGWREVSLVDRWTLLWPLSASALLLLRLSGERRVVRICGVAAFVPASIYLAAYVFTGWEIFQHHVTSSYPRLLIAPAMACLVAIGFALQKCYAPTPSNRITTSNETPA